MVCWGADVQDISRLCGTVWRGMSDEDKQPWTAMASDIKKRLNEEFVESEIEESKQRQFKQGVINNPVRSDSAANNTSSCSALCASSSSAFCTAAAFCAAAAFSLLLPCAAITICPAACLAASVLNCTYIYTTCFGSAPSAC